MQGLRSSRLPASPSEPLCQSECLKNYLKASKVYLGQAKNVSFICILFLNKTSRSLQSVIKQKINEQHATCCMTNTG